MIFSFGDCELDSSLYELRREGRSCAIEPKVFDLLLYLVQNRERVVTKDEVHETVWKGRIVSEATLSSCINAARRAIGDSGKKQTYIRTLPRRGFRFVGDVNVREAREERSGSDHLDSGRQPVTQSTRDQAEERFEPPVGDNLSLPDKPSIAVLPFVNMSADPEQGFFSDGISEDIITALSKIDGLLVVARNSTFTYKGQAVDVKQVSREQGVRYVLEGSVRKVGNRVRITAQLMDATTGHHLWAERYDRDLEDIFAVQDEITREVVIALDVRLRAGEQARFWSSGTKNLEAWECVRRSWDLLNRGTQESVRESMRLCRTALELDSDYPMAWVVRGWVYHHGADVGLGHALEEDRDTALVSALESATKALELDPSCADAYCLLSTYHLSKGEYDEALAMSQKAVALAPNHSEILALSANVQIKSGYPERGLELIRKAMRLSPIFPAWYFKHLGASYRLTGQTDLAIDAYEAAIKRNADFLAIHVNLAATLGEVDRQKDAKRTVAEVLRLSPEFSIKTYMEGLSYRDPSELERFESGLRKAGLPE